MKIGDKYVTKIDGNGKIKLPTEIVAKITEVTEYVEIETREDEIVIRPVKINIKKAGVLLDISVEEA